MTAYAPKVLEADHREKPDGGYCHVPTFRFGVAWWCYLEGILSIRAVRVLLGLHELIIRRSAYLWGEKKAGRKPRADFTPRFTAEELGSFCGLPEKKARAAVRELLALGLVTHFSNESIQFAPSLEVLTLSENQRQSFQAWLDGVTRRIRVPFPRRILALACEASSPAQIALILAASLRCIYLKPKAGGFSYHGWMSSAWVSRHFGICLRSVKAAKAHLVELGWIEPQGRIGRFGELLELNPAWKRLTGISTDRVEVQEVLDAGGQGAESPNSAPLPVDSGSNFAPPKERESSTNVEIQRPRESQRLEAENGPGIYISEFDTKTQATTPKAPRLSNITPADFKDTGRAMELYRQAVKCRLVAEGEFSQIRWLAAIERARTVQATNPAGVFLHIVKNARWDYLSNEQIFAGNARLKAHLHGTRPATPAVSLPVGAIGSFPEQRKFKTTGHTLSEDAKLVKAVRSVLAERRMRDQDPLPHLQRHDASWNRDRLVMAEIELSIPNYRE